MLFIALMSLTTTCVAGAAAFFSVYGLAHTFSATFWSVVIMGGALEAGKLMITSYLYRFRDQLSLGKKFMGMFFVFGLMMVTSLGIYGYLADSYQSGTTGMKQIGASLQLKKEEQASLQKRKSEIDDQIARVPDKDTRGKQRLITQFGPEVNTINQRLIAITAELQADAQKQITTDSHVGPIVFIAKIVGLDPDRAMSYFILIIVFLFDPVAIYMTVATNEAMEKRRKQQEQDNPAIPTFPRNPPPVDEDARIPEPWVEPAIEIVPEEVVEPMVIPSAPAFSTSIIDRLRALTDEELAVELAKVHSNAPVDWQNPVPEPDDSFKDSLAALPIEDVAMEEDTEADPIDTIKEIYNDITSKETQTPADKESVDMIERFLAKQKLVKAVRTGNIK